METKKIYEQMVKVMEEIGAVKKNKSITGSGPNYKFRGIDDFINAVHPALITHKVFITPIVISREEKLVDVIRKNGDTAVDKHVNLKVKYIFYTTDGSSIETEAVGEGIDTGDKATGKAYSMAYKYNLIQTFAVPTEDMEEGDSYPSQENVSYVQKDNMNKNKPKESNVANEIFEDKVLVEALVSKEQKDLAKAKGFKWNGTTYKWTKELDKSEIPTLGFEVKIVGGK